MKRTHRRLAALLGAATLGLSTAACGVSDSADAEDFPTQTIDVIVPYPPGGGSDVLARALVDTVNASGDLSEDLQVVNRDGGGGVVGVGEVLSADPDGYTVAIAPEGPITLQPQVAEVSYEPLEMTPIAQITRGPVIIAVPSDSPFETLEDLIKAARENPGQVSLGEGPLSYAVPATQIEQLEDVSFKRVDYEGDAASTTALLGGNVDATFTQTSGVLPQVKSGDVRVLAVGSPERSTFLPDVPTFAEAGVDLESVAVYSVFGPAGIPDEVGTQLTDAFLNALESDDFQSVAESSGLPIEPADGETLMSYFTERYAEVETVIENAEGSL